jgi:hypothetical protein
VFSIFKIGTIGGGRPNILAQALGIDRVGSGVSIYDRDEESSALKKRLHQMRLDQRIDKLTAVDYGSILRVVDKAFIHGTQNFYLLYYRNIVYWNCS